ncbi:uncharacterized protein LAESUDRAFT_728867 [Laetiporus sulphureus 93-53]|uniref:Uncharacterized protein n=1 Tax=Laetiporus sulphureus 93-53 TaxID=1314785 RepID=A0A165D047_9APHY|nr:uncharacterized protein LAESUDRAFT_728867 [Laetiporus sulphureus 93-53]KZT03867.1 hypothetical protein LAESUDRAFT_728867 [Laetiporus sulphureus 93-53]
MSDNPALEACAILTPVLDSLGVRYALMGGAACAALGSGRATRDIDLCIVANSQYDADTLSRRLRSLPQFTEVDEDNVGVLTPAIQLSDNTVVPIEIFDSSAWPERPQYQYVESESVQRVLSNGTTVSLFSAPWQLREKIAAAQQRGQPGSLKGTTDISDIRFLCSIIPSDQRQQGLLELADPEYIRAFEGFLQRPDVDDGLRQELSQIISVANIELLPGPSGTGQGGSGGSSDGGGGYTHDEL